MFIDYAEIFIKAGDGGNGAVAFRREKFVPKGGPSGGNGGKGGDIVFKADRNISTLLDLRYKKQYLAENGKPGGTSLKDGKDGPPLIIRVPVGTIIKDAESGQIISDLKEHDIEEVILKGGRGGKGNSNFATPVNRTPRYAEDGKPGGELNIILELKLLADVGLVGFPNAGKSTLISRISAAKPKIADYPFTTLVPNLGIVKYSEFETFTVADIPGIIEGAHEGKGLGIQFLRHIERTKILILMVDAGSENPADDFKKLLSELEKYSKELAGKEKFFVLTKADTLTEQEMDEKSKFSIEGTDEKPLLISSVSGYGLKNLLDRIWLEITSLKNE